MNILTVLKNPTYLQRNVAISKYHFTGSLYISNSSQAQPLIDVQFGVNSSFVYDIRALPACNQGLSPSD